MVILEEYLFMLSSQAEKYADCIKKNNYDKAAYYLTLVIKREWVCDGYVLRRYFNDDSICDAFTEDGIIIMETETPVKRFEVGKA